MAPRIAADLSPQATLKGASRGMKNRTRGIAPPSSRLRVFA